MVAVMVGITYRRVKQDRLTNDEVDNNFQFLDEKIDNSFQQVRTILDEKVNNLGDLAKLKTTGEISKYLNAKGEWAELIIPEYSTATSTTSGLMSASDKIKLDRISIDSFGIDLDIAIQVTLFAPFSLSREGVWEFSADGITWNKTGNLVANTPYYIKNSNLSPSITDFSLRNHIKEILYWGENITQLTNIGGNELVSVPDYLPPKVTSLRRMFAGAKKFNHHNIRNWNTSNVTDFSSMFEESTSFNQDISSWNTTSVLNMNRMFYGATSFNQDLSRWDGSNASNADFASGSGFEEDTSKHPMWAPPIIFKSNGEGKPLTYVSTISAEEDKFYQLAGKWYYIAADRINNNDNWAGKPPRLGRKPIEFYELFGGETSKLSIIDNYLHITIQDKHGVTKTIPLSQVITSRLISTLPNDFELPNNRTTPIGTIADISTWDTSNLTSMGWFLSDEVFLQVTDISQWNTSKVTNMDYAFSENSTFNQDLSKWCVPHIKEKPKNFADSTLIENSPEKHPKWGTCPRGESR
ncbi:bacterial surface protein 26-residue repeat [Oligella urethralis]|uniref:Bacterial surface protein 26-residue repeat n=2 Tax=Oligella urethralis TaxID=90245 RepID=A0A2X1ULI2_9BURK|nr:bacterial surface protein 26-residue repeat [Oligella urethralis]